jgi:hypothetical protein
MFLYEVAFKSDAPEAIKPGSPQGRALSPPGSLTQLGINRNPTPLDQEVQEALIQVQKHLNTRLPE